MAAARATDADREVALSLGPVLRDQEVEQRLQPGEELLRLRALEHPLRDPRVVPRVRLEALHEVRIRQEADVEHQIARIWYPVAVAAVQQCHVVLVVEALFVAL